MTSPGMYTIPEAATRLATTTRTIQRLIQRRKLPVVHVGGLRRIPREAVEAVVRGEASL